MRRAPIGGLDLTVYLKAVPLLLRNPSIVVVPLLMAVAGVLIGMTFSPSGAVGVVTSGLAGLIVTLLELFGLAVACVIADDAWRHGRASFDRGGAEAQRRAGDILYAALGVTFILSIAQFTATLIGPFALILMAAAALFLIWAIPAAALGGIPGAASIQMSIERVRANPLPAVIVTVVTVGLVFFLPTLVASWITLQLQLYTGSSLIIGSLITALIQAIATGYVALVLSKTYTDSSLGGRRW